VLASNDDLCVGYTDNCQHTVEKLDGTEWASVGENRITLNKQCISYHTIEYMR
jgi:hypothetical protein